MDIFGNPPISYHRSPLRYPGAKTQSVPAILGLMPQVKEMASPFFGGGSVEIALSQRGVRVHGYDKFNYLVMFWREVLTNPDDVADIAEKYYPITKDDFLALKAECLSDGHTRTEYAAMYFVINRASFSGLGFSGSMSDKTGTFTPNSIQRMRDFRAPNISVDEMCFDESIPRHPDHLLYLDPPYLVKKGLYGVKGDHHDGFNHEQLADLLMNRENWLLSYNDCPEIRELYKGRAIIDAKWSYKMTKTTKSSEVFIMSDDVKTYNGF